MLEGRPARQGARLTAWELGQIGVPTTVVVDAAAAPILTAGGIAAVLVRADGVATNGDVRAPIGTLATAIVAARAHVPVIVLATTTAVDPAIADGSGYELGDGVIDERGGRPDGPSAVAQGFPKSTPMDVTAIELIDAIVTEEGILRRPFDPAIRAALARHAARRWKQENRPTTMGDEPGHAPGALTSFRPGMDTSRARGAPPFAWRTAKDLRCRHVLDILGTIQHRPRPPGGRRR